jgi:hypothetical protein
MAVRHASCDTGKAMHMLFLPGVERGCDVRIRGEAIGVAERRVMSDLRDHHADVRVAISRVG